MNIKTAIGDTELDIAPSAMLDAASDYLNKALANLSKKDYLLKTKILNRQGNVLVLQGKLEEALKSYKEALVNLPANNNQVNTLRVNIKLNILQAAIFDRNEDNSVFNLK